MWGVGGSSFCIELCKWQNNYWHSINEMESHKTYNVGCSHFYFILSLNSFSQPCNLGFLFNLKKIKFDFIQCFVLHQMCQSRTKKGFLDPNRSSEHISFMSQAML